MIPYGREARRDNHMFDGWGELVNGLQDALGAFDSGVEELFLDVLATLGPARRVSNVWTATSMTRTHALR